MTNQSAKRKGAPIREPVPLKTATGRVGGWYNERTKVLTKRVEPRNRVKAFGDAIAFDADIVAQLADYDCQILEATNPEDGHKHRVAFAIIIEKGIPFNFGYGDQVALPLRYWVEFDASGRQVEAAPTATPEPVDVQLGLFDEAGDGRWSSPMPGVYWGTPR